MCPGDTTTSYALQGDETLYMGEKFSDLNKILSRPSVVYILEPPVHAGPAAAYFPIYPPSPVTRRRERWIIPKNCRAQY